MVAYMLESLAVSSVIDNDDAMRAPVVAAGDGAEALLPGSVPDLQLDGFAIKLDRSDFLSQRHNSSQNFQQPHTDCRATGMQKHGEYIWRAVTRVMFDSVL